MQQIVDNLVNKTIVCSVDSASVKLAETKQQSVSYHEVRELSMFMSPLPIHDSVLEFILANFRGKGDLIYGDNEGLPVEVCCPSCGGRCEARTDTVCNCGLTIKEMVTAFTTAGVVSGYLAE